jgi:hypothetical protein
MSRLKTLVSLVAVAACAGGCNSYNLRYRAQPQPKNAHLFADYLPLQSAVGFSIDTDGGRLEEAYVRKPDGSVVHPANIVFPGFSRSNAVFPGVGIGTGHVGFGLGAGIPVGPEQARGLTTATFAQPELGSPPWELHVKIRGVDEAVVPGVGGPATAK